jgi:hypothetical protein
MLFGYLALLAFLLEWRDASRPHPQQELEYDEEEMEPAAMELSGHAW